MEDTTARAATRLAIDLNGGTAGSSGLPLEEEFGDGPGVHAAHGLKLAGALAEEELAVLVEDGEGWNAFFERHLVAGGDGRVHVHVADIDVYEDEVAFQDRAVGGVVQVDVEYLAVAAPVAAEVEQDALVALGCGAQCGVEVGAGVVGRGIDIPGLGRSLRSEDQQQQGDAKKGGKNIPGSTHGDRMHEVRPEMGKKVNGYAGRSGNPYTVEMTDRIRQRLEEASYPDLDAMMLAYAVSAVEVGRERYGQRLDYSSESMVAFEAVLSELTEPSRTERDDAAWDYEVKLWGAYLGEVLRRRYAGSWEMTRYPGGVAAMPAIEVRGSRLFPLMKVYRRITMGDAESIAAFFQMVTERLGEAAKIN